jgi:CDP-glycerol glycerophosphotransferase
LKVNTRNPRHWLWLIASGFWAALAAVLRPFRLRNRRKTVLLYGHKLGGNLLSLYRHLRDQPGFEVAFLSLDPDYAVELASVGENVVPTASWRSFRWLVRADALVSDHGLHSLEILLYLSDIRFFDTWHGIPFKGFDGDDFRVQHRYHEVWVASPAQRDLWIEKFGFDAQIVHATGYARTDRLVNANDDIDAVKRGLGLDPATCGKVILFAPTWKQDASERSLFPFGIDATAFLLAISGLAASAGATVLLRTHLNSGEQAITLPDRVVSLPYARFPDTESILLATDVLVCDWSSIAFDFLLLHRPTIFLDVDAPFAKGMSLDASYRYGAVADDMRAMMELLTQYLQDPLRYVEDFGMHMAEVRRLVYDTCADGRATERCIARLEAALARVGSSR